MGDVIIRIGIVKEVETTHSKDAADGLRVRLNWLKTKQRMLRTFLGRFHYFRNPYMPCQRSVKVSLSSLKNLGS